MGSLSYSRLSEDDRNYESWDPVDVSHLTEEDANRFERLRRAIQLYLRTGKLTAAALEAGCSQSVLLEQLRRCLSFDETGHLVGWSGLIKGKRIKPYRREAPINTEKERANSGKAGAFEKFLSDHENLREVLHRIIRKGGARGAVANKSPDKRSVFKTFQTHCLSDRGGMTVNDYPWNTKSRGRRSVERYIINFIENDRKAARIWLDNSSQFKKLGTGHIKLPQAVAPLDCVCFDAHKFDCLGTVVIPGPAGPMPIVINRLWVVWFVDDVSKACVAVAPCIGQEIRAGDIVRAAKSMVTAWRPKELVKGLRYLPGACLPAGNLPGLEECRPALIRCDNAAQHYARRVLQDLRIQLGANLSFNPIHAWWRSSLVERTFSTLEICGFRRLPSTTGKDALDHRGDHAAEAAIKHAITWEALFDAIESVAANFNVTTTQGLGNRSPIDSLKWELTKVNGGFFPRMPAPTSAIAPPVGVTRELKRVGGLSEKAKGRAPYIEIDRVRHTGKELYGRSDLMGEEVIVHIDEENLCSVDVFETSGKFIGAAIPTKAQWQKTKHTRDMRKAINQLIDVGAVKDTSGDVVLEYLGYLAKNVLSKAQDRSPSERGKIVREATHFSQQLMSSGLKASDVQLPNPLVPSPAKPRPKPAFVKSPKWKAV